MISEGSSLSLFSGFAFSSIFRHLSISASQAGLFASLILGIRSFKTDLTSAVIGT